MSAISPVVKETDGHNDADSMTCMERVKKFFEKQRGMKILWIVGFFLALVVTAVSMRFWFDLAYTQESHVGTHYRNRPVGFYMHVVFSPIALVIAFFQLLPFERSKKPSSGKRFQKPDSHRYIGLLYAFCCLVSSIASVPMALDSIGSMSAHIGFVALAVVWFVTTFAALIYAKMGKFRLHRMWILRSFACTLAAISLRIQLGIMQGAGVDFGLIFDIVGWSSWVPNLVVCEIYLWRNEDSKKHATVEKGLPELGGNA